MVKTSYVVVLCEESEVIFSLWLYPQDADRAGIIGGVAGLGYLALYRLGVESPGGP